MTAGDTKNKRNDLDRKVINYVSIQLTYVNLIKLYFTNF